MTQPAASLIRDAPSKSESQEIEVEVVVPWYYKLAVGGIAGVIGTSVVFPMDTIKTRMMGGNLGPVAVFRNVLKEGGPAAFYRGLAPNLVGVTPEKAIKLGVNDILRGWFSQYNQKQGKGKGLSALQQITAGACAGLAQCIATNPMEVSKIHMQQSPGGSTIEVVRQLGLAGLYRGVNTTLLRDIPFSVIMFPGYAMTAEAIMNTFRANLPKGQTELSPVQQVTATFTAGALAGAVGSAAVTPMDVIKTRVQGQDAAKYDGMIDCFRKVTAAEGFGALWAGVMPRMVVVGALFGVSMLSFEMLKLRIKAATIEAANRSHRQRSAQDYASQAVDGAAGAMALGARASDGNSRGEEGSGRDSSSTRG